jgi:radical SAM protein with 4Fe4S-binding SPASM domain
MTCACGLPLDWVDTFIADIKSQVFLRRTDHLLILLPNQSYRLNPAGFRIMEALVAGKKLSDLFPLDRLPENIRTDLYHFFIGVVAMVKGCLGEGRDRPEVETVPYEPPFLSLPILSEIAVTYRCNLACHFCYAGCTGIPKSHEMSLPEIITVLRKIRREAEVPSVSLTGGEPTLRPDLPEIVAAAKAEGMRVNLISNGTLISDALAQTLVAAGLDSAQISIEGPSAEIHDRLTGIPGSFAQTLSGLATMRRTGISVHTNTTISHGNLSALPHMPAFVKTLEMTRFSMNMIIPSALIQKCYPELLVKYRDIGPVVQNLRDISRREGIRFLWYSPTPYCLFNPIAHNLGNKGCAACDGLLSITPAGEIIPCSSFFEPQGSLLDKPFAELWQGPEACHIRNKERAPASCRSCDQFSLCEGACPLYWNVMGEDELTAPSPSCCPGGEHGLV